MSNITLLVNPKDYKEIEKLSHHVDEIVQYVNDYDLEIEHQKIKGAIIAQSINREKYTLKFSSNGSTKIVLPQETELESTKAAFNIISTIFPVQIKKKVFYINLIYPYNIEITAYYNCNNKPVDWCEVNIDIPSAINMVNIDDIVNNLPFALNVPPITGSRTPKEQKFVNDLYETKFKILNYAINSATNGVIEKSHMGARSQLQLLRDDNIGIMLK